jgi:hypothetical protein
MTFAANQAREVHREDDAESDSMKGERLRSPRRGNNGNVRRSFAFVQAIARWRIPLSDARFPER